MIDLPGQSRAIQSAEIWYNKGQWASKSTLTLFGLHSRITC
jgi:hypothetical protein